MSPLRRLLRPIVTVGTRHPFAFGVGVASIKAGSADILVQKRLEKAERVDWRRVRVFTLFGALFCGCWQYFLYNKVFTKIVPGVDAFLRMPFRDRLRDMAGLRGVGVQVFIENGFNNAFCYFPVFYTVKIWLEEGKLNPMLGIARAKVTFSEDVWNILKVWVPAQTFNFFFCPLWARVSFTALVSFGFTAYVSALRGLPEVDEEDPLAEKKTDPALPSPVLPTDLASH